MNSNVEIVLNLFYNIGHNEIDYFYRQEFLWLKTNGITGDPAF